MTMSDYFRIWFTLGKNNTGEDIINERGFGF